MAAHGSTLIRRNMPRDHGAGRHDRGIQAGPFFISMTSHHVGQRTGRHRHAYACFHYVLDGTYAEATRLGVERVPARNGLWKAPELPHWNEFTENASTLRIEYPPESLRALQRELPDRIHPVSDASLTRACSALAHELAEVDDCSALAAEGLALEILANSMRRIGSTRPSSEPTPPWLVRCEELLRAGYRKTQRFGSIARELDVSRTHLATVFRRHFGSSMGQFVRTLRVENVMTALEHSEATLAQIAVSAGFADQSHCARVFRRHTGLTPAQWRRQVRT
jgi:AraC family transcriptional regulator